MKVKKLWFDDNRMYIETNKQEVSSVAVGRFPRLERADSTQRSSWKQYGDGLRWEDIDEDISLKSFAWADDDVNVVRFNYVNQSDNKPFLPTKAKKTHIV